MTVAPLCFRRVSSGFTVPGPCTLREEESKNELANPVLSLLLNLFTVALSTKCLAKWIATIPKSGVRMAKGRHFWVLFLTVLPQVPCSPRASMQGGVRLQQQDEPL